MMAILAILSFIATYGFSVYLSFHELAFILTTPLGAYWPFTSDILWFIWTVIQSIIIWNIATYPSRKAAKKKAQIKENVDRDKLQRKLAKEQEILVSKLDTLKREVIYFDIKSNDAIENTEKKSKLGGKPYLPAGNTLPTDKDGSPLLMAMQLNLSELPSNSIVPKQGILQFFVAPDISRFSHQETFTIRYYHNTNQNNVDYDYVVPKSFPIQQEHQITASKLTFEYPNYTNKVLELAIGSNYINNLIEDVLVENTLKEKLPDFSNDTEIMGRLKLGGYAYYIQDDRSGKDSSLVLQIPTIEPGVSNWGDGGSAYFEIPTKFFDTMKSGDFSHITYYWDCY